MGLIVLFSVCLGIQVAYWLALAIGFRRERLMSEVTTEREPSISVVVAARNEVAHLPLLLDDLMAQDYPRFEVLVVDDGSTDGSAEIVRARTLHDERFHLVTAVPAEPRKKNALRIGIEKARYDRLAFTDADCRPGPGWLRHLAARAPDDRAVVVGYSPFRQSSSILNSVSRYETFVTGFLTAAAAGLGRAYMAVGRNLSYSKALFESAGGFGPTEHSLSGDDDLFVQTAVENGAHVAALLEPGSFVPTVAPHSWSEWLRQKRRHASAGRSYRPAIQGHLAVFHISGHAMWLAPILAGMPGLALLCARLTVQALVLAKPAAALGERDLMRLFPLWELAYALYNALVAPVGLVFRPTAWKTGSKRH